MRAALLDTSEGSRFLFRGTFPDCPNSEGHLYIIMSTPSAAEAMDKLQLSDEDTEDLWTSPSKRQKKPRSTKDGTDSGDIPESSHPRNDETLYDREEAREVALRNELESVRNINQVIEGVVGSLEHAKGNMEVNAFFYSLVPQLAEFTYAKWPS